MMVNYKSSKASPKGWKLQKTDAPGPGHFKDRERAFYMTLPRSSLFSFGKEKRVVYAEAQALNKKHVPSPLTYDMKNVNEKKIYKPVTTRRF